MFFFFSFIGRVQTAVLLGIRIKIPFLYIGTKKMQSVQLFDL